ncbi:M3 family oligoendopeptidase [Deinococcus sp. Leaf326]|jgi:oligoendopeptidase F|uniref:M3 family oligoendopeptidase n=1 Tax=Deinococcus sp. Leaf326 TaxID=1736338 RepID=UPI00070014A5|nr:M3 family oligoendopeptidase [Deinococcus sp. Leaf326]KQR22992.1 oligoendopeptidase F [Deinococcus sp. Leaf326]
MTATPAAARAKLGLPESSLHWPAYEARYRALLDTDLGAQDVPAWLTRWSDLTAEFMDAGAKLSVDKDLHTADEAAQARYQAFVADVVPPSERMDQALKEKLLAVPGYVPAPDFALTYRRFRDEAALFREANVDLGVTHQEGMNRHAVLTGNQQVVLDGKTLTIPQAKQRLDSPERTVREAAWRALAASNLGVAPELDRVMEGLIEIRWQFARNAGLGNFRDYVWKQLDRVDYEPADCRAFHEAVRDEVVPLLSGLVGDLTRDLGLEGLRPWDYNRNNLLDAQGREPLRPFSTGEELETLSATAFAGLDEGLAARFTQMRGSGLLDLESRPGKMTHAYCAYFPVHNEPFVLMNVVGTAEDVRVLFHEVGHAFHGFYSGDAQPLVWNRWSPIEFVEIPSMAMEFLTLDHLAHVFSPEELARYRFKQLEGVIAFLPWAAQMDAFQHWLYAEANEHVTVADLDAKWLELDRTFHPFVNWDGLEDVRAKGWHYYHIFQAPFYYIEYAMCYLASVALWRAAQADPAAALDRYKAALRLGNTVSVPELYRAAGAEFRFDREYIKGLMAFVREQMA